VGAKMFFIGKSIPISGFDLLDIEKLELVQSIGTKYEIIVVPKNSEGIHCSTKISYRLSELYF
jgi:hypothetical protein